MRLSYRLVRYTSGWLAECVENDAAGEGSTPDEAVAHLHAALVERLFRPDAVAPPEDASFSSIELVEQTTIKRVGPHVP